VAIADFERWREELLFTGRIVRDDDKSVSPDEAQRRVHRYLELVEAADGTWTEPVFQSLVDSLQVDDDYEVYETTVGQILAFPPEKFGPWFVKALPDLLKRQPERAADILSLLINNYKGWGAEHLLTFRQALHKTSDPVRQELFNFIAQQEREGWLKEKPGYYVA
jgi:hypothetical protein